MFSKYANHFTQVEKTHKAHQSHDEFETFFQDKYSETGNLLIIGNFDIHVHEKDKNDINPSMDY